MVRYINESKADEQKLRDFAGDELADLFFKQKQRLKSPENDIYYWLKKSPEELEDRLKDLSSTQTRKQKSDTAREGAELVAENDYYKVYHITTYEASVKYGKHTQWCISGSKRWSNGERGEEYFNNYTSKGVQFYFFIPKTDENEKYAIAFTPQNKRYQIFNETDDEVDDIPDAPELKGIYLPPKFIDGMLIENNVVVGCDKNKRLNNVKIPSGVTSIGKGAFEDCEGLTSITIANSVTSIGESAFRGCTELSSITIPGSVTSIGNYAFLNCWGLTSVIILDNVTSIGTGAFAGCTGLTSITIPDSITTIGMSAFSDCKNLKKVIYKGKGNMLDNIDIDDYNDYLINAYKQTINR